jgi:hypothetical protein
MNSQHQQQPSSSSSQQYNNMPSSSKIQQQKSSPLPSSSMPSVSSQQHQQQQPSSLPPKSNPPASNSSDLQQYKTDSKLYELLEKTRTIPDFNRELGDEILENLYDFSLDCSFFAKQRPDGKFVLPIDQEIPSNLHRGSHPGMLKMPPNAPFSQQQPGPSSSFTPQQQWAYSQQQQLHQQPGPSMQRPPMAGPLGQQQQPITPSTPLPAHPPEFHRFNQQAPMRHVMQQPGSSNPQQQMRSPFYPAPTSSMTPEQQHQMYLQQQQQQQQQNKNAAGPGSTMMSPTYSQVPTTPQQLQQQHGGQFSRQSSFKMNTPQPMIKQENNPSSVKQQQQHGYPSQQQSSQDSYFQSRPLQRIDSIDSNDNEMKPPIKQEIMMDQHRMPPSMMQQQQQQRMNGIMGPPSSNNHYPQTPHSNDMMSPKFQIKNELMSPQHCGAGGRPQSTSLIINGVQQSPLQANGQPMSSSMGHGGQTNNNNNNVSPLVAITPPIGDGSPGCSSMIFAAGKAGKPIFAHAMDDPHRSTASPASETSTASTSSRKRVAVDDDGINGVAKVVVKRARCNQNNMTYRNMIEFIRKYLPSPQENRLVFYICDLLLKADKASKRVLEWRDEARTFIIAKPRVFADKYKEALGLPEDSKEAKAISTTKMEKEMDTRLSKIKIGLHQLIQRVDNKTYTFLVGIQESPNLRENKSLLDLHPNGNIFEYPITQINPGKQQKFPLTQFANNNNSGAPITA